MPPDLTPQSAPPGGAPHRSGHDRPWAVFLVFLKLGLTAFGGPVAHIAWFRDEFVTRRQWLTERAYADLVALCQFLPGPASSQVGMALGLSRAGWAGALAAWIGFTLPSALLMILLAHGVSQQDSPIPPGLLQGLKVVAVAVVAQAVWGMARTLCPDRSRISLMVAAACGALAAPGAWTQIAIIVAAGLYGALRLGSDDAAPHDPLPISVSRWAGGLLLAVFTLLLAGLPLLAGIAPAGAFSSVDAFYRSGALVFGGGHVVLPLLQQAFVPNGQVDADAFLAGYGAAQALPGPLFTFAAFLGASMQTGPTGWAGGLLALVAIFTPAFLLVAGALPFWERLRRQARIRSALAGINASVVGLLLAALYQPVWTSAIHRAADFALALVALVALTAWRAPPWLIVAVCGGAGWLIA